MKTPVADWLPYPPSLYINIGFGLKLEASTKKRYELELLRESFRFHTFELFQALKIIKNILLFDEILSKRVIQDFIIAKIINQHLIMKLNNLPKVRTYDFNGQIILWFVIFEHFRIPQR